MYIEENSPCYTLNENSISSTHSARSLRQITLPYSLSLYYFSTSVTSSPILSSCPLISMPTCKFFSSASGCARGDQCYYKHVKPVAIASPANRAQSWRITRNEKTPPAGAPLASFPHPVAEVSCRFFSIGACKNGDGCRFRHEAPSGETLPSAVPQHGSNNKLTGEQQDNIATGGRSPFPFSGATNIQPIGHPTAPVPGLADPLAEVRCRYFSQGTCRNGDHCRFRHETRREEEPGQDFLPLQASIDPFETKPS